MVFDDLLVDLFVGGFGYLGVRWVFGWFFCWLYVCVGGVVLLLRLFTWVFLGLGFLL